MTLNNADALHDQIQKLSPRQMAILGLLADGKNYEQTATILSISVNAIKRHVEKMRRKTNLNKTQLIVMYAQWQMLMELDGHEKEQ